jgi:ankyrin repeat protein
LSWAAEKGDEPIVQLLIEHGAQPDLEDKEGQTPLSRAMEEGNRGIVALLQW